MISDILSDAVYEIRTYQRDMPKVYDSRKSEIDRICREMTVLRKILDAPPRLPLAANLGVEIEVK